MEYFKILYALLTETIGPMFTILVTVNNIQEIKPLLFISTSLVFICTITTNGGFNHELAERL